jgi:selenide, water dikinase
LTLNRAAARAARAAGGVHACTDITGFGLLGHAAEMASRSEAQLRIRAAGVPLLPGALGYAAAGAIAGGLKRNRAYFETHDGGVAIANDVDPTLATLLFDPQTSGGLLLALDPTRIDAFRAACAAEGATAWEIGEVVEGAGVAVV